jgi:hypothetical protein
MNTDPNFLNKCKTNLQMSAVKKGAELELQVQNELTKKDILCWRIA